MVVIDDDCELLEDDVLYPTHTLAVIPSAPPAPQTLSLKALSFETVVDFAVASTCRSSSSYKTPRRLRGENGARRAHASSTPCASRENTCAACKKELSEQAGSWAGGRTYLHSSSVLGACDDVAAPLA